jgi:hypothetical protein
MNPRVCILSLSHMALAELEFHRQWHKRCGCAYRAIWQTANGAAPDWAFPVDIPGKIVIPGKMRIYCHYAKKLAQQFDHFVFLDSDAFIIDPAFVAQHIARMEAEKHQVMFTHLTESEEHYKAAYYGRAKKVYKTPVLSWSLNVCTFVDSGAAQFYDEHNDYKIYDEVDFACFARANFRWAASDRVDLNFFTAGRAEERLELVKDGRFPPIVHAVKDYGALARAGVK